MGLRNTQDLLAFVSPTLGRNWGKMVTMYVSYVHVDAGVLAG